MQCIVGNSRIVGRPQKLSQYLLLALCTQVICPLWLMPPLLLFCPPRFFWWTWQFSGLFTIEATAYVAPGLWEPGLRRLPLIQVQGGAKYPKLKSTLESAAGSSGADSPVLRVSLVLGPSAPPTMAGTHMVRSMTGDKGVPVHHVARLLPLAGLQLLVNQIVGSIGPCNTIVGSKWISVVYEPCNPRSPTGIRSSCWLSQVPQCTTSVPKYPSVSQCATQLQWNLTLAPHPFVPAHCCGKMKNGHYYKLLGMPSVKIKDQGSIGRQS